MSYKQVTSNEYPEQVQMLQGKKLINIDVIESVTEADGESNTNYVYTQLAVDLNTDTELAIRQYRASVAQEYLNTTDYIDNKYISEVVVLKTSTADEFITEHIDVYDKRESARIAIRATE